LEILASDWNTDEKRDYYWDKLFRIRKLEGRNHTFSHHISTDGYAIDFHYKRMKGQKESLTKDLDEKLQKIKENYEKQETHEQKGRNKKQKIQSHIDDEKENIKNFLEDKRVLGLDPGRVTIIYLVEDLGNGKVKKYKLSRCHYYHKAGINRSRKLTETWMRKNKLFKKGIKELSNKSLKTMIFENVERALCVYEHYWKIFWEEKMEMKWRINNFNLYKGKKKVFSEFFNKVEKDNVNQKQNVISYGSAKFSSTSKGELAALTSRAYKECASRYATFLTNEFRSTIVKYNDNVRLWHTKEMIYDANKTKRLEFKGDVRGLLWFSNPKTSKLVDRDLNAALNIRQFLLNGSYSDPIFSRKVIFRKERDEDKYKYCIKKMETEDEIQRRLNKIKRLKKKNEKSAYKIVKK